MCTIFLAPKMRTELSADAVCYQDVKFRQREQTEDRKGQLSMKWVAVTDERGNRRLQMRWTVAVLHSSHVPFSDTTMCSTCDGPGAIQLPARRHE